MKRPFVSVIIPTYNRPGALAELLEALTMQTYQHFEVIIINDAGEPVDAIVQLYPELTIHLIDLPKNQLHVYARNQGIQHAAGAYIMFIDDDDLILCDHMKTMVKALDDSDLVYADAEIVNYREEDNRRVPLSRKVFAYTYDKQYMREFSTFVPSGSMYRAEIHEEIGLLDESLFNYWDWDFFLRVQEKFRVKRVAVASVLYDFSETGTNQSKQLGKMRYYLDRLAEKHGLGHLPTKNFFLLLEEPAMKQRQATTERIWDGEMISSRYAKNIQGE
ncbi:glycosyltransferase [Gracilibacillus halophilus YIM-C55.5]|uniref:Glycosyltransferase n=1 Tax=Gracilibacillus halophilus YIM-C55.5 TaxID=1308866 RepID=N4WHF5_9BACI|nr:glycosyltransferase family 2 protein [Gracilibacillus halophilus]ENH95612.1 glycosyltransferase [Gracilibacillus halophilus YIM-C55.5]